MKIAVTGAAGFIGSHVTEALIARGHDVVGIDGFDDFLYPAARKRANARALAALPGFALHALDLADTADDGGPSAALTALVADVDVVCHLAALAGVRPSLAQPARYLRTNLIGTSHVLEAMRRGRARRLVFASSSSVYGARPVDGTAAFREDDPCLAPASPYAASKRAGELLCRTWCDLYGIGAACLRFFTVYGPRGRPDMAIWKFVEGVAHGRPITMYGDGTTRRDYTFIADITAGVVAACERVQPAAVELYNLGNTRTVALHELIATVEDVVGRRAIVTPAPAQPGDVPITYADITRAARDLGFRPQVDLASGVRQFWDWYQRHGALSP